MNNGLINGCVFWTIVDYQWRSPIIMQPPNHKSAVLLWVCNLHFLIETFFPWSFELYWGYICTPMTLCSFYCYFTFLVLSKCCNTIRHHAGHCLHVCPKLSDSWLMSSSSRSSEKLSSIRFLRSYPAPLSRLTFTSYRLTSSQGTPRSAFIGINLVNKV